MLPYGTPPARSFFEPKPLPYYQLSLILSPETISVIGLGYVGLAVAVAFGQNRPVIAFDINTTRLAELRQGHDRTGEVSTQEL